MAPTPPQKPQAPAAKPAAPPTAAAKPAAKPVAPAAKPAVAEPKAPAAAPAAQAKPPKRRATEADMHANARKLGFRPEDGAEFKKKAAAFFVANDFSSALDAAKLAAACDPLDQDHWVLIAASHAKLGQLKAAVGALKRSVSVSDDHIPTWVALGEVFISGKNFSAAMKALQKAVELDKLGTHPGARRARMLLVARKQWTHGLPQ